MKKITTFLLAAILLCGVSTQAFADVKLGVLAHRGELDAIKTWTKLSEYFTEKMGEKVELVPLVLAKNMTAVENAEVDFIMTNPVISAAINDKYSPTLLATLNKKSGAQFGGVIIASKKSGVESVQDLKGKKVMTFIIGKSAGANVFQHYHLMQKGVDVNKDLAAYKQANKQDDIVLAVKAGVFDAGFIRTGMLESMEKSGKIKMDDVVVLDEKDDDFPQVHSTALYPEWFLMALSHADAGKAEKLKAAALSLTPEDDAAKDARIKGFVEPLDLEELTNVLKTLKLPPFDQ